LHRLDTALDYLRRMRCDVVLLDLELPDSSGVRTYLRLAEAFPQLPVVVLAESDGESSAAASLRSGASDCVTLDELGSRALFYCLRCAALGQRLRLAEEQRERARLDEQRRLARELHDGAVQELSAIRLRMQLLAREGHACGNFQPDSLHELAEETRRVLDDVRQVARGLHPSHLESRRLDAAMTAVAEQIERATGVRIDVSSQYSGTLTPTAKQNLYRIFLQSVQNAIRHGDARRVTVSIQRQADQLHLHIFDDGCGFDSRETRSGTGGGMGLVSIRERAELLGGSASIESARGEGTAVKVSVPALENIAVPPEA
jgi:signal transduction histidine kinase